MRGRLQRALQLDGGFGGDGLFPARDFVHDLAGPPDAAREPGLAHAEVVEVLAQELPWGNGGVGVKGRHGSTLPRQRFTVAPILGAEQLGLLGVELFLGDDALLQEFGEFQQFVGD